MVVIRLDEALPLQLRPNLSVVNLFGLSLIILKKRIDYILLIIDAKQLF